MSGLAQQPLFRWMASARQLSKLLRTKCGFRQRLIAVPKPPLVNAMASGSQRHHGFAFSRRRPK
jgi:hypothetical protein